VRLLGEDGVVGLEVVLCAVPTVSLACVWQPRLAPPAVAATTHTHLLEHLLAVADLHVEQRVAKRNEVELAGHDDESGCGR